MEEFHSYQPSAGHGLKYNPLPTIIGPRPIAWISSKSSNGILNLAPYSFFNLFNYSPPIIAFSSVGYKDSIRNIDSSKDFVCNIVDRSLASKMNLTSIPLEYEISEFDYAELGAFPSDIVSVPRVLEAKIALECRLSRIFQLSDSNGVEIDSWMIVAEVVKVHINKKIINNNSLDLKEFKQILRGGGKSDYYQVELGDIFYLDRPVMK